MSDPFDFTSLLGEYRDEARQQIDLLDRALLMLEDRDTIEEPERMELLRALHTLKGNSAMIGIRPIADKVHVLENVFKAGRGGIARDLLDGMFELSAAIRSAIDRLGTADQESALARVTAVEIKHDAEIKSESSGDEAGAEPSSEIDDGREANAGRRDSAAPEAAEELPFPGSSEVVRVPFAKLDDLLTTVGELVGFHARLESFLEEHRDALRRIGLSRDLEEHAEDLADRTSALRRTTMELRLVPLRTIFGRFRGLVRELARDQGKRARLVIEGDEIEVDKSTADALAEPLLHLLRNAVDHGIEIPDVRSAAGKEEIGTIVLQVVREGDRIRITLRDDGPGLDRAAIQQRAREVGLITGDDALAPSDVHALIFRPGFSTRSEASTVSGRGIGLDIVRRGIMRLRGSVEVKEAEEGGTEFTVHLPLTLAIVPALIFESDGEVLAVPAIDVQKTLAHPVPERAGATEVVRHDGTLVPIAWPGRIFGWGDGDRTDHGSPAPFAVVLGSADRTAAISADRLVGQQSVVVKAVPGYLGTVRGVSGVIAGADGRVALLLDSQGVLDLNMDTQRRESRGG